MVVINSNCSEAFDNITWGMLKLTLNEGGYGWQFIASAVGALAIRAWEAATENLFVKLRK